MSKERRRARYARPEPETENLNLQDLSDDINQVLVNHEKSYTDRLSLWAAKNRATGLYVQASIYDGLLWDEALRQDPDGKLAIENGDTLPTRNNRTVDWGDM